MPEGDTIFRSARTLHRALAGKVITRFETSVATLARADDEHTVIGRTVERVEARGKWLIVYLSGDLILLTHMLMNGSWHIYRIREPWRRSRRDMRVVVETHDWLAVGFTIPVAEFHSAASLARKTNVAGLGPDLLREDFNRERAIAGIHANRTKEIADVLLNQHVLTGIGNVFKSEICFAAQVNPFRRVETLTSSEIERILEISLRYLKINVIEGATTGARRTTNSMDRSNRLWVYARRDEPCRRCGTPILTRRQGSAARVTFWCPDCQKFTPESGN